MNSRFGRQKSALFGAIRGPSFSDLKKPRVNRRVGWISEAHPPASFDTRMRYRLSTLHLTHDLRVNVVVK
jgi:hypothetical protein